MLDRRAEPRLLCADVVAIEWTDKSGHICHCAANLEDISQSGLGLQVEHPLPLLTTVHISHERGELVGRVKSCVLRHSGTYWVLSLSKGSDGRRAVSARATY